MSPGIQHVTDSPKGNPPSNQISTGDPLYRITNLEPRDLLPTTHQKIKSGISSVVPKETQRCSLNPKPFWSRSKVGDGREMVACVEVTFLLHFSLGRPMACYSKETEAKPPGPWDTSLHARERTAKTQGRSCWTWHQGGRWRV